MCGSMGSVKSARTLEVQLRDERDIVAARQAGRELAREMGFGIADQTRLATAISEIVRNALRYGGGGICVLTEVTDRASVQIRVVVEDNGPGIPDIEKAMTPGFSTGRTLGAGMPGAKRLVHDFRVESKPGLTRVTMLMLLRQALERIS